MENISVSTTIAFSSLDLPEPVARALDEIGFDQCTEIQSLALPEIISGKDIAAQAQTGTGKTAAFLVGLYTLLLRSTPEGREINQPRALILAPTRELAIQIHKDAEAIGKYSGLKTLVAYGGTDYEKQRTQISEGVDILIGTPGRLIDYFKQKIFNLRMIECVVLDEADRMFDLGFIADIRFLLRRMPEPEQRHSMLFSATLSHRVMELAYEHMNNPEHIKTEAENITASGIQQSLYHPSNEEKIPLLLGLIEKLQPKRSMIFTNTKRGAEKIEAYLKGNDISCGTLSGDVRQTKRQRLLQEFSEGKLPVLIATDVAARGLHIDGVTHVFNYDLPQNAEDYVHRIGRTARAGTTGEAISFACEETAFSLMDIESYIGKTIPPVPITDELLVKPKPPVKRERKAHPHKNSSQNGRHRSRSRHSSSASNENRTQAQETRSGSEKTEGTARRRRRRSGNKSGSAANTAGQSKDTQA
ncbi:DEAD/DEAH box helicase [Granulosicoccaceae sp. 1_MG-2023]|nr:DEAD/DEAH box helicase [Granulosicoccaceae sp. 1_MG-2023]